MGMNMSAVKSRINPRILIQKTLRVCLIAAVIASAAILAKDVYDVTRDSAANPSSDLELPPWYFAVGGVIVGVGMLTSGLLLMGQPTVVNLTRNRPSVDQDRVSNKALVEKRQAILELLISDQGSISENRIKVFHAMSDHLVTVPPDMGLFQLELLMHSRRIRHALVVNQQRELLGVVSDRDLFHVASPGKFLGFLTGGGEELTAAEVMTAHPATIDQNESLFTAVTCLLQQGFSCLPVMKDGKLAGILTSTDLLMTLQCTLHILQKASVHETKDHAAGSHPAQVDLVCS